MTEILKLEAVEKIYGTGPAALRVLADVNLTVEQGEYLAIIGPSGSGKSTLLNIFGCLDVPSTGRYLVEGRDTATLDDTQLSHMRNQRIGFVFQSFHLVSHLTVLENVELPLFYARKPRGERRRRALELIAAVGLKDRAGHRPAQLSGGERQRTAIARALANDPAVLLADEPTGNLDTATSGEIMGLIEDLHRKGATVVLITHDAGIARLAPRRVALRDGRIESDSGRPVPAQAPALSGSGAGT